MNNPELTQTKPDVAQWALRVFNEINVIPADTDHSDPAAVSKVYQSLKLVEKALKQAIECTKEDIVEFLGDGESLEFGGLIILWQETKGRINWKEFEKRHPELTAELEELRGESTRAVVIREATRPEGEV